MTAGARADLQLVQGGRSDSDRTVLRELYEKHGSSVYARCLYLLKERAAAEDAMQDVFAKALTGLDQFRAQASPLTWLLKIATNHCLNSLRSERAAWKERLELVEKSKPTAANGPHLMEKREQVRLLLQRFDPETQAVAIHYHVDEMTLEEVAQLLGRSVPTIRKRLEKFATASGSPELQP